MRPVAYAFPDFVSPKSLEGAICDVNWVITSLEMSMVTNFVFHDRYGDQVHDMATADHDTYLVTKWCGVLVFLLVEIRRDLEN